MRTRRAIPLFLASVLVTGAASADGAAGRLDGDVAASAEAGLGADGGTRGVGAVRVLYLATAGAYGIVDAALDESRSTSVHAGVEIRPLFLPRFLRDLEHRRDMFEVALDSFAIDLGLATFPGSRPGLELGAGVEIPLLGRYDGPFVALRAAHVFSHEALAGSGSETSRNLYTVTLGWRLDFLTHAVDAGDTLYR